jgi:hypothetical protein
VKSFLVVIYASYLINVGILLIIVPWSAGWSRLMFLIPTGVAHVLDHPAMRGALSAFGALHLMLLVVELVSPNLFRYHHRSS